MEEKKIIIKFKKKIKELKKHNELYFNQDNPEISDKKYDEIKKELIELERNYPYLKNPVWCAVIPLGCCGWCWSSRRGSCMVSQDLIKPPLYRAREKSSEN